MDQSSRQPRIVGRLAPSPTGKLHVGHARTFLIAWLSARAVGGRVVLRIEDLDAGRVRPGAAEQILEDLRWLGLDWDEGPDIGGPSGPYRQADRQAWYDRGLDRLKALGLVYPCTCTRAEIARAQSAPHAADETATYPGTCRWRTAADAEGLAGRPFAWRLRVEPGEVVWTDRVLGRLAIAPANRGGDFVVGRSTGEAAYQLAVVLDDAAMGVTEVVRGDDLVPSTPRQLVLYRALGFKPPRFAHVPLAVGPDGRRLAKRDESLKLATLREAGWDPRRLVGLLAKSCGWTTAVEPSRPADWLGRWSFEAIPRAAWTVDPGCLGVEG